MKAKLIYRNIDQNYSISIQDYSAKNFLKIWHYHPELELDIIHTSTGTRFIGDSVEKFEPGDIVLIGKNLPHLWLNDKVYFDHNSVLTSKAKVIHFTENFGSGLLDFPEMADIQELLKKAELGISFKGNANNHIIEMANEMYNSSGYKRVIALIDILGHLANHDNYKTLSSLGFANSFSEIEKSRMAPVYEFVMNNFKEEIKLETVANLAFMNPSSFSRYFTKINKKSFTRFLNEIRIGYACKLLIEEKSNVCEVCYESGFNNLSNFNIHFKKIMKMTPTDYTKLHKAKLHY